jgi:16S rRNA processing protein RimM
LSADQKILVGRISGLFGIQGWLKIYSYTQPRENVISYNPWHIKRANQWQRTEVISGRRQAKTLIVKLQGIDDRRQAADLLGADVAIDETQLESLSGGDYYWVQLIGLRVINLSGLKLGVVERLMETGAQDVLVVKGDAQILIPFVQGSVVKDIDLDKGFIMVDWEASW